MLIITLGQCFICQGIIAAVKRVKFVKERILYIILRGHIILNVHATTEDKSDDSKCSFYKELECVFNQFQK
jgi:hypothetical protein